LLLLTQKIFPVYRPKDDFCAIRDFFVLAYIFQKTFCDCADEDMLQYALLEGEIILC
jgi:hypothetical protein